MTEWLPVSTPHTAPAEHNPSASPGFTPHHYTRQLLQYAASEHTIPDARLQTIRDTLTRRTYLQAQAYQPGSTTITRNTLARIYNSLFYQLDVVLLELHSDTLALQALKTEPLDTLLTHSRSRVLQLFSEIQELFPRVYQQMKPFATALFLDLKDDFAAFIKQYDIRYAAEHTHFDPTYPPLMLQARYGIGLLMVHSYVRALQMETEFCTLWTTGEMQTMLTQYAKQNNLPRSALPENIADLALRHCMVHHLGSADAQAKPSVLVSRQEAEHFFDHFTFSSVQQLHDAMLTALYTLESQGLSPETAAYFRTYLPTLAQTLHRQLPLPTANNWLAIAEPTA